MSYYKGKYAIITGGSEGIGKAIAIDLAKQGCSVTIIARKPQKLESALTEMEIFRQSKDQFMNFASCDVVQYEIVKQTIEKLIQAHGVPDFLINVAGYARPGFFHDLDIIHFDEMMNLNYFGIVHTCKAVVPHMIKARKGTIVNTSSMAGFLGVFGYTGYCASKFAVIGFSEALMRELKPFNIQVSALCPPNTKTPGLAKENENKPKEVLAAEEKAKTVTPEEVSKALLKDLPKNKFIIVPTIDGSLAYYLNRLSPKIIDQFIKRKNINV